MTAPLLHQLDRSIFIKARRDIVFRHFTDTSRWAAWWGAGSTIDARPGGKVLIRYPGGVEVAGEVTELVPPERIVFTYGYTSGKPFPSGTSLVTIRLHEVNGGTRLELTHRFAEEAARDQHLQGWRYQLAVFANVVTDQANARAAEIVDAWFAAWSSADADERRVALERIASPNVRFADRFGLVEGRGELIIHIAAVHTFMPGTRIVRQGEVSHCQGKVLAAFSAGPAGGHPQGRGSNVFALDSDGLIEDVTGFWSPAA